MLTLLQDGKFMFKDAIIGHLQGDFRTGRDGIGRLIIACISGCDVKCGFVGATGRQNQ
jgi:hypothetical protein